MVKKTPAELHQDRARMKLRLDDAARLEYAREQGEQIGEQRGEQIGERRGEQRGLEKGELLGRVKLLKELLGLEMPTTEELAEYDPPQLTQLAQRLQAQLRDRP